MTTIKSSAFEGARKVDVLPRSDGRVNLQIRAGFNSLGIQIPTADLLAALGVDPGWREKVAEAVQAQTAAEGRRAIFENRAVNARLERDDWKDRAEAAEAKLARVREVISKPFFYQEIKAALADPEPFVLPTTPGARFEARWNDGDLETFTTFVGDEVLYRGDAGWNDAERFGDGAWHDFRLLDGGE